MEVSDRRLNKISAGLFKGFAVEHCEHYEACID